MNSAGTLLTSPQLDPRTVQIVAEAYELSAPEVTHDVAMVQAATWSGLELLIWLHWTHQWHASTCVYYLAALRRALRGMPPPM